MNPVTIPTWQSAIVKNWPNPERDAKLVQEYMQAEIDDLRAALQAAPAQPKDDATENRALKGLMLEVWACAKPNAGATTEQMRATLSRCLPHIRGLAIAPAQPVNQVLVDALTDEQLESEFCALVGLESGINPAATDTKRALVWFKKGHRHASQAQAQPAQGLTDGGLVPFDPGASHIHPEYRDGWNAALAAIQKGQQS